MEVTRSELEHELDELARTVAEPRHGVFGPDSITWEVARHATVFLGAGRAALLQLAHPMVAHAIEKQSYTRKSPTRRFLRTFRRVFPMIFGELDAALDASRRVHRVHEHVRGTIDEDVGPYRAGDPYLALDAEALLWVHATLFDSARRSFELVVRELTPDEAERHYQESKRFLALFGVPSRIIPPDEPAFRAWLERMLTSGPIAVGRAGRELARFLMHPTGALSAAAPLTRVLTAGLLPPSLRAPFGLPFGPREARTFEAVLRLVRRVEPRVPPRARFLPAYLEGMRRCGRAP
jgi:uncharacterized protein (DUF2236 family)